MMDNTSSGVNTKNSKYYYTDNLININSRDFEKIKFDK